MGSKDECKMYDGVLFYMGRKYVAENPVLKTIDSKGVCSFYGFKMCLEDVEKDEIIREKCDFDHCT